MDLNRKLEIARDALKSIATHSDADADIRKAALDLLKGSIGDFERDINNEVAAKIGKLS